MNEKIIQLKEDDFNLPDKANYQRTVAKLGDAFSRTEISVTGGFPVERRLLNYMIKDLYIRSEAGLSVLKSPFHCKRLGPTGFSHCSYPSIVAVHRTLVEIRSISTKLYLLVSKQF